MKAGGWSLRGRLSAVFALWTGSVLVAVAGLGIYFIESTAQRELDDLAREELGEQRSFFEDGASTPERFQEVAHALALLHPRFRLGWRVWDLHTGELWGQFGDVWLFDERSAVGTAGLAGPSDEVGVSEPSYALRLARARFEDARPPLAVLLVVDGSESLRDTRRLEAGVAAAALVAVLLSCGVGMLFGRKVSAMVVRVARSVRSIDRRATTEPQLAPSQEAPAEIRAVTDALAQLLERIREEEAHARLMTTGLAHELRSPVQNLVGATEVALLRERDAETYRELLRGNLEELRELATAVDNLVVLVAGGNGPDGAAREHFDLGAEVELRLRDAVTRAERAGVALELSSEGDLGLDGDREALLLAVRNVIGNAIQWSPEGGRVRVRLRGGAEAVEVEVEDEGPGIPEEERELVFEPFRRGAPHPRGREGYGLGLALTRKAVEGQGGRVEVARASAGGALFRLRLPRRLPPLSAPS